MPNVKAVKIGSSTFDVGVLNKNVERTNNMNTSGAVNTIDRAFINNARANRTAFLPAAAIVLEYSTNSGSSWSAISATDAQKQALFAETRTWSCPIGAASGTVATTWRTRVTITPTDRYNYVDTFYVWLATCGHTLTCDIERSTIGNPDTFTYLRQDIPVSGYTGPNEIAFVPGTFGGGSTQTSNYYKYRFTFKVTATGTGTYATRVPYLQDLRMYGASVWTNGNNYAANDHLYSWDYDQNVTFPKKVTATSFSGDGSQLTNIANNKVTQAAAITTNGNYCVLLAYSTATSAVTNSVNKSASLTYNPSTGALSATKFIGDGSSLTNVSSGSYVSDDVVYIL